MKKAQKFLWILALITLVGQFFAGSSPAAASEGIVLYDKQDIQGYHVTVLGRPNPITVGKISLLVRLAKQSQAGGDLPARGAKMLVEFYHVSGPGSDKTDSYLQRRDLAAPESEPGTYEVADSLQNEGVYRITLKIQDGTTNLNPAFEITAQPQPDDRLLSVLILSIFPILLAWLLWMYLKKPTDTSDQEQEVNQPEKVKV